MAPPVTALVSLSSLALGVAALALAAAWRLRARADRDEVDRRLDALAERVARLESRPTEPSPAPTPTLGESRPPAPGLAGATRTDRPAPGAGVAPSLISVPNLAARGDAGASAEAVEALGRRFAAVWRMADAGNSAEAIARASGYPVGQVELILGLRRQLPASATGGARGPRTS